MNKTVTTLVSIGKSKVLVPYTFLMSDFVRIEDDVLILKSDDRRLKLSFEEIKNVLLQMNNL